MFPGVVQHGAVAVAEASGAPLAVAPDHWTDGCPVLIERLWEDEPPANAGNSLQSLVSRLRSALREAGPGYQVIESHPAGLAAGRDRLGDRQPVAR